ncbi:hypothetical protein SAMN05660337_3362 [Maridesulfovibrio ferrireducens]|uniref:LPP20 lipoprotein n=1 Tax=Maridesulfovibrio ferrireducens TaxID=246191 RepID=A0A1G9LFS9_9BACT|nr:hypothetical protein [Maridesulfovibrio ferrireducens]SDL60653.1 hypothetical protein SAMN05660337_3362 [Maridesulfovibrio ferrireducens]
MLRIVQSILLSVLILAVFMFLPGCRKNIPQTATSVVEKVEKDPNFIEISDKTEAFYKGFFQVVGRGSGENKAMALLAARSVAQARLVEIINGVEVERQTLVEKGRIKSDQLRLKSSGVIRFASVCGERYNPAENTAEVCMRLALRTGNLEDIVEFLIDNVE